MVHASRLALILVVLLSSFANPCSADYPARKKVLLLGQSPDGHKRTTHEYMAGVNLIAKCLERASEVEPIVVKADDPWTDGPELLSQADAAVLFLSEGAKWVQADPRRLEAFAKLASRGGGLVTLHWGMGTKEARYIDAYLKLFGGCHGGPDRKYKIVDDVLVRIADHEHPITFGIENFQASEEFYYRLKFVDEASSIQPLLQVNIDDNIETVAWAWQRPDGGRSSGFSGGHFHENWKLPQYRRFVSQAILWSLKLAILQEGLEVDLSPSDLDLELPAVTAP
jgi:type 1 glutamine amidotransferase